jgi:transposase-like protein
MQCKKCQSTHVVKNGRTPAGQQKYHCRDCGVYTVTDDRARERAVQRELVEHPCIVSGSRSGALPV